MPLILPGNVASALGGAYEVANSCRFNDGDSAYMHKTPGSSGNRRKFTFSCWIKKGDIAPGDDTCLFSGDNSGDDTRPDDIRIRDTGKLYVSFRNTNDGIVSTQRVLRDPSAWMNIVVAVDTEQGTAANRVKIYINGVQESNLEGDGSGSPTYPSEDHDCTGFGRDTKITVGARSKDSPDKFFDGYMAEVCYIDGSQLAATSFGEFDEDSPTIWKPKDVSGLTFGTNGFYLDFEASDNLGNDANGGTDLTEVNLAATDQSTDTCTNNFATLNPLLLNSGLTFSEGNLNLVSSNANYRHAISTIAVQNGKWYAEFKAVSGFSSVDKSVGIYRTDNAYNPTNGLGNYTTGTTWSYGAHGDVRTNNGVSQTGVGTFTDGDIIAVAMDLDNNKLYFAKNNTWINSGDPESGATGTGSYAITSGDFYHFAVTSISSGGAALWSSNFGSPNYANSSDAADANGYGAFEYAPPSGYLSLCTKNLGSDGG